MFSREFIIKGFFKRDGGRGGRVFGWGRGFRRK